MALIWKEVIRPGTYWYTDEETKQPRCLTATSEHISHWHESGKKMLEAGLSIPIPLEHQPDARALTKAERAAQQLKDNAGWVKDYAVHKDKLFALCDIADPEIGKKLPTTIRWTSPWFHSFTDGDGNSWDGVISHLALTTRPRITRQEPFPSMAAALSLAANLRADPLTAALVPRGKGIALSRAGLLLPANGALKPVYPLAFSLWSGGIRLAAAEVEEAVKEKKKPPVDPKAEPVERDEPAMPDGSQMLEEPSLIDSDGDISVYDVLCDLMEAALGITLPEGTTADNFLERAYEAFWEKMKMKGKEDPLAPPPEPTGKPPATNPIVQEQAPMFMSLEDVKKAATEVTDPKLKAILEASLSLQETEAKKGEALRQHAFAEATKARQARIERLKKKRKDPAFVTQIEALAKDAKLALSDTGMVNDSLTPILDVLEAGMPDLPALLLNPAGAFVEQPQPKEYDGKKLPESRRVEVRDELAKNAGLELAAAK